MRRFFTPISTRLFCNLAESLAKRLIVRRFGYDRAQGGKGNCRDPLGKDDSLLINNRQQNGRRRGRGNNNQRPQGGNTSGSRNQDNGNRIDNRSRGNAAQLLEKYKTLARDAQQSGDRVLTEYYLQFSDHYFRVLADTRARYEENQPRRDGGQERDEQQSYDGGDDGEEIFDGDEFDPRPQSRVQAPQAQPRYDREPQQDSRERQDNRQDNNEDRPRRDYGDRPRNTSNNSSANGSDRSSRDDSRRDAPAPRQEQARHEQARQDQPRQERPARDERPREDRPREDRPRDDRPRQTRERAPQRERQPEREDAPEASTLSLDLLPPAITTTPLPETAEAPVPKRRGRPKKIVDAVVAEG
jgi:Domain of unknown function (DUF4167)